MDSLPEINLNPNTAKDTAKNTASKASASLKAAGNLVAKKAERTKLVTVTLPRAYAELGKSIYKDGSRRDEFLDLFQSVETLLAERKRVSDEAKGRPAATTVTDKARKVAADAADMARVKAIDVKAFQAFAKLGEAVFVQHGESAGDSSVLEQITKANARRDQLDREVGVIHASAKGQWITPKRIVVGCAILVGVAVLGQLTNSGTDEQSEPSNAVIIANLRKELSQQEANLQKMRTMKRPARFTEEEWQEQIKRNEQVVHGFRQSLEEAIKRKGQRPAKPPPPVDSYQQGFAAGQDAASTFVDLLKDTPEGGKPMVVQRMQQTAVNYKARMDDYAMRLQQHKPATRERVTLENLYKESKGAYDGFLSVVPRHLR